MDTLLEILRETGLAGISIIAIWFAIKKDKQATDVNYRSNKQTAGLYDRLEAKTEKYLLKYTLLSTELNQTLAALTDALDLDIDPEEE